MFDTLTKELVIDNVHLEVDWLMYRSYSFNRSRSPHIEPDLWKKIYINAELYEKIYQGEKNDTHN